MLRFGHRVSKAIDVFIGDAQALACLSPRLNDRPEQANALELILPLGGIIVAGDATREQPGEALDFMDRRIPLDTIAEIPTPGGAGLWALQGDQPLVLHSIDWAGPTDHVELGLS